MLEVRYYSSACNGGCGDPLRPVARAESKQGRTARGGCSCKAGAIAVLKDFDDKAPVYAGDASDAAALKEFVDYHRTPVAMLIKKGDQAALQVVLEDLCHELV